MRSVEAAKIVALCNTPYKPKFYTLTFRSFSPTPGAFEFHPGNLYFFIGTNYLETSSGAASGHQQRRRSRPKCSHPPMRLVFRIHENSDVKKEQSMNQPREMPIIDSIIDDSSSSSISLTSTLMLIYILLLVILNWCDIYSEFMQKINRFFWQKSSCSISDFYQKCIKRLNNS